MGKTPQSDHGAEFIPVQQWTDGNGIPRRARIREHIAQYVRIIGPEAAASLFLGYGGAPIYFAERAPAKNSALLEILTAEQIGLLASELGIRISRVPMANAFIARHMRSRGASILEIARTIRVADKTVRIYLRGDVAQRQSSPPSGSRRSLSKVRGT